MDRAENLRSVVADLERRRPDLKGKRLSDIPELAGVRYHFRRKLYRQAEWGFALAIFNLVLAVAPGYSLWPVSVVATAVAVSTMIWAEGRARAMTRQLHRPAIEQMARDLAGLRD